MKSQQFMKCQFAEMAHIQQCGHWVNFLLLAHSHVVEATKTLKFQKCFENKIYFLHYQCCT
jgi:hypothetical protein